MLLAVLRLVHDARAAATDAAAAAEDDGTSSPAVLHARLARGERAAERELVGRATPLVRSVLAQLVGPTPDLDDLTQEAFVRVFLKVGDLEEPAALFGFVRAIAVNVAREALRARRRRWWWRLLPGDDAPETVVPDPSDDRLALIALERAIAALEVEERVAFSLRYLSGLGNGEVATAMGVSIGTVKRRLATAETAVVRACGPALGIDRVVEEG
jgi:RNA polymerase sigma-70 factor (ECF subfamily)